jgi:hypothetical protein
MSDTAVEESATGEAFDMQQYAERVIGDLEAHPLGETLEVETSGIPCASPIAKPSIRSRLAPTLGRLRIRRDEGVSAAARHAGSQEPVRYRYDVPTLRIR